MVGGEDYTLIFLTSSINRQKATAGTAVFHRQEARKRVASLSVLMRPLQTTEIGAFKRNSVHLVSRFHARE
jgi:hypothetical protein